MFWDIPPLFIEVNNKRVAQETGGALLQFEYTEGVGLRRRRC